jgi:hypothetical protein
MRARPSARPCLETLEGRVLPSSSADVQLTYATTTDARTVSVNYTVAGADLAGPALRFDVYRSAGYNALAGARLVGSASVAGAGLSAGPHPGVKLSLTTPDGQPLAALTPDPARPFLVVVANPDGAVPESDTSNNTASFETHVLGVVVHGLDLDPLLLLLNTPPAWEVQMASALQQQDGYEAVIPFNWVGLSFLPFPGVTELAAGQLAQQVVATADGLASQHPGDVVDVNFIGHSRGNVVVSQALQALAGTSDPALRGGYLQMTMLDPHPANDFGQGLFSWLPFFPLSNTFAELVLLFQGLAQDPPVVVPANVSRAYDFDQQTPAGQPFRDITEVLLNFWGEPPGLIPNLSGSPISEQNLTGVVAPGIGLIGHYDVHDWYLASVVNTDRTFTYFG